MSQQSWEGKARRVGLWSDARNNTMTQMHRWSCSCNTDVTLFCNSRILMSSPTNQYSLSLEVANFWIYSHVEGLLCLSFQQLYGCVFNLIFETQGHWWDGVGVLPPHPSHPNNHQYFSHSEVLYYSDVCVCNSYCMQRFWPARTTGLQHTSWNFPVHDTPFYSVMQTL